VAADDSSLDQIIRTLRRLRRSVRWQSMHRDAYRMRDGQTLSVAQVDALEALLSLGSTSIKDLAAYLLVDAANLSRTVSSLVAAGLVKRVAGANDRRTAVLMATARGRLAHDSIAQRRREQLREVLEGMEPERRVLLADLLEEYLDLVDATKDDEAVQDRHRRSG
jgi:DNA-binding MarR family transcriptional regulator